jgi:hypothetical protein
MALFYACSLTPDKEIPPLVVVYLSYIALSVDFETVMKEASRNDPIFRINGIQGL